MADETSTITPDQSEGTLEGSGASFERSEIGEGTELVIGGIELDPGESGVRYEWTLPEATDLNVVFAPQGKRERFLKVFTDELELEDETFDDAVYIKTEDTWEVREFFEWDERLKDIVFNVVVQSGEIGIEGDRIVYEIMGGEEASQGELDEMATFVEIVASGGSSEDED